VEGALINHLLDAGKNREGIKGYFAIMFNNVKANQHFLVLISCLSSELRLQVF
jgi:hypothetical protein